MFERISEAKPLDGYRVWLRFADGTEGDVDLTAELYGEIFEPLKQQTVFSQLAVDPATHTIVWPNGADFSPEFLRSVLRVAA